MDLTRTEFPGGAFDPSLPDGRSGATLHLMTDRVRADCGDGRFLELRYATLRIEIGGASGRMALLRGPSTDPVLHCEERGFLEALRAAAGTTLDENVSAMIGSEGRRSSHRRIGCLIAIAAVVLLAWGIWLGIAWA